MKTANDTSLRTVEKRQRRFFRKLPTIGVFEAMRVTLRTMLSKAATVQYPDERIELPERTRGVIALLPENCTVCMLCAKECPCWCIYIEGHKVTKPGKRKPLNELDRFAIDFGLCMYCGICVEVCPFDALHWSPFFEYTSYTYEGMVHEAGVLEGWENKVLPPPELVTDADPKARDLTEQARTKREEGVWAVIREQEKKDAYLLKEQAKQSAATVAYAPPPIQTTPISSDTPPDERPATAAVQAPAAPVPAAAEAAAPQAPDHEPSATDAVAPAADLGDVPRIDPNNLPEGIGPVERGRLKKLAKLQEEGHAPTTDPVDLIAVLKPVLDQIRGAG
jgi:formate hydrogenlyase subunit 6/NADH:ubiquinone oxidoreductase subunit I